MSCGLSPILLDGLSGLVWAERLRGFMAQIVGEDSSTNWSGTAETTRPCPTHQKHP